MGSERNGFDGNMEDVSSPMPLKLPDLKVKVWTKGLSWKLK